MDPSKRAEEGAEGSESCGVKCTYYCLYCIYCLVLYCIALYCIVLLYYVYAAGPVCPRQISPWRLNKLT